MVERPATVTPIPDPTALTSEAIDRRVDNAVAVIEARLNGMEKAVAVFHEDLTRVPTQLDRAILSLRDVINAEIANLHNQIDRLRQKLEARDSLVKDQLDGLQALVFLKISELGAITDQRFIAVGAQFSERDTRTDQRAGDTKLAVDAAFAAAKEATAKIESSFTKSIDEQQRLLNATTSATIDKISDLKDRMTAMENRTAGITSAHLENRAVTQDSTGRIMAIIAITVALLVGVGEIFVRASY